MTFKKITAIMIGQIDKLPIFIQRIIFKTIIEIRYLVFRLKMMRITRRDIPNPAKIYFISPERIVYHTNYLNKSSEKSRPFPNNVFDQKIMRGKVVDGDWDISPYKFTDLAVYTSLKKRIVDCVKWQDTELYKILLKKVESGVCVWDVKNKEDLDKRCMYLDSLIQSIKNGGYKLNRANYNRIVNYDEIDVNIGRNGEYLFQNGVHRLSIAKILGIKRVPVTVFVRHKKWQEFRQFVVSYSGLHNPLGKLYQPLVHPDLADIPYVQSHDCHDLMETIKNHLEKKKGVMLDIGANVGFFCHKFEDLSYRCYAVELDPSTFRILEKVKTAENKKFSVFNKSIFDVEFIKNTKFDVVLALSIFHHFLKQKKYYRQLKDLLKNLETDVMFFQPHLHNDTQMDDAYVNYTETEFIDFIISHTSLNKSQLIYTSKNGRHVFKLSK